MNKKKSYYLVRFRGLKSIVLFLLLFVVSFCHAQQIPNRPSPPRLVNDFTNTLTNSQTNNLEYKLRNYNDTTSTQIAVCQRLTRHYSGRFRLPTRREMGRRNKRKQRHSYLSKTKK